jgi:ATP-binding cassette, subfamily C, bacterial exporter for protease/lipase
MRKTDMLWAGPQRSSYRAALAGLVPALLGVLAFSAVLNVLMLTGSVYMLQVYDRVLASGSVPTLVGLFAIVVVLYGFLGFYDFLRVRLLSRAALGLDQATGATGFDVWTRSGVPGQAHGQSGASSAQPLRDLDVMRGFLAGPAVTALFDLPFVPLYLGVLFIVHPWLGWVTVAGAIVTAWIAWVNRALTQGPVGRSAALDETERDFADKSHRNAESILAMGMQPAITARWRALRNRTLAGGQQGSDPSEMLAAGSRAFRMLLQSGILTLGAYLVLLGEISGGMIIASSVLSGRALAPVDQLIGQWRSLGKATAAHQRLDALFVAQAQQTTPIALPDPTGQISVTGLTRLGAARPGAEQPRILSDISFALNPGDGLGVIGNSACGKSTLARLLVGATQPDQGEIRLDGATPDQWDPVQLGRRIGYLPQTVGLLPGTIRDNIARFDPLADDADVIAAAKLTGVHEMILKLPDGYATQLGRSDGVQLSGGQVQRLGLARAIFGMPAIVVLDEPNSNLDVAGDNALTQTIATLRQAGSTVIVMAHRPSAIAAVNKLMILEGGKLIAFGDKEEVLMDATGLQAAAVSKASVQTARLRKVKGSTDDGPDVLPDALADIPFVRIPVIRPMIQPAASVGGPTPTETPHIIRHAAQPAASAIPTQRKRSA